MKIQLKRSNVLDGGSAKMPTAGQMEYGELAVNYNTDDPAIFIKDSNDGIVRIAGVGATGQPDWGDGTGDSYDSRYVKVVGDNMTGDLTLGTDKIKLNTSGLGEFAGGVRISGGQVTSVVDGIVKKSSGNLNFVQNSHPVIILTNSETNKLSLQPKIENVNAGSGYGCVFSPGISNSEFTSGVHAFRSQPNFEGLKAADLNFFSVTYQSQNAKPTEVTNARGYLVDSTLDFGTARNVGFHSKLQLDGDKNFNFYSENAAPSFYKGSKFIGGNTARNTFELWKSTLTEEQLEQLEAGTFAVPANVSTPGDGSYARQWYYDQQDAETQALLASGELEYPAHLAAATFTDTFTLGEFTYINLNSNGSGTFTNRVTAPSLYAGASDHYFCMEKYQQGSIGSADGAGLFRLNDPDSTHGEQQAIRITQGGNQPNDATIAFYYDGNAKFDGKLTSASTVSGDSGTTLVTKDYVDANSGGDTSDLVTLDTEQTITGQKTFNQFVKVASEKGIEGNGVLRLKSGGNSGIFITSGGAMTLQPGNGKQIQFKTDNPNGDYRFFAPDGTIYANLRFNTLTSNRNYTFPDTAGTIALTSDLFSGSYNDLSDKPSLFSGSYNDLTNKPTIGNGTITIVQPGTADQTFTVNQSGATTITLKNDNSNTTYSAGTDLTLNGTQFNVTSATGNTADQLVKRNGSGGFDAGVIQCTGYSLANLAQL